jgi:PAS domain-containing protein
VLYSLAWVAICSTAFLTLIDYGVNLKFSDPSMTQSMILAASTCVLVNAVFMSDAAWSAIGVFIIVAFSFSTFKGSKAWLLRLCAAIVAMIAVAVMVRSYLLGNGLFTVWQSIPMVATMVALAIYGGLLNEVKNRARQQQILANLTLENLSEAILNLSPDGRIVAINQYASAMLKRDASQLIGIKLERLLDSITPVGDDNTAISLLATASSIPLSTKHRPAIKSRFAICVDGDELQIESTTSRVFDHDGTAISQLVILRDITDQMALLSQLNYAATHDPLTGLLNRRGFDDAAAKVERELLALDFA